LAERVASLVKCHRGWEVVPEVSFAIYGERGVIDQVAWHQASEHMLILELKTAFVDINEALGTLDRKVRLAQTIAAQRGWRPSRISVWLVVSDTRTNRRHAAEHSTLLASRFKFDGRKFQAFLRDPSVATTGLVFMTDMNPGSAQQNRARGGARL
jgi:hypothetical protein